ncbi:MAG: extracellular solute-binding protein, partial [Desulfobacterales bacterium]
MKKLLLFFVAINFAIFLTTSVFAAKVNVVHGWPAQQGEAFEKVVNAFRRKHPDIEVIVEVVGRDRPAYLATRLAAGNPPDLTPHPWLGL